MHSGDTLKQYDESQQDSGLLYGSSFVEPLHGKRRMKMYLMQQSDVDLIIEHSRNGSIGGSIVVTSVGLAAAAYWDVLTADISGPNAKLYFGLVGLLGVLGLVWSIVSLVRRNRVLARIEKETERKIGKTSL